MRSKPIFWAGMVAVAAVAATLAFVSYRQFATPAAVPDRPAIGGPFTLQDGDGRTVTDRDFRGQWLLIYFGYTHCPDACPTSLSRMAAALDKLGTKASEIMPIFITIDPERDTPAVVKDYAAAFGKNFRGLTGSPEALRAVEHEYRVYAEKHPNPDGGYDMDHSSVIYLIGPDGRFVTVFNPDDPPERMTASLAKLLP